MKTVKLGDFIEIKHGWAFPGSGFGENPNLPQVITPGNFSRQSQFVHKVKSFDADYPEEYNLKSGDLVVSMTDLSRRGDTLGLPAIIPQEGRFLHNQRIGKVSFLNESLDSKFLFYLLRTRDYHSHVISSATGTTVRHTSPSRICDFEFIPPSLDVQVATGEILGALDDKIAANQKIMDLLRDIFRAKYHATPVSKNSQTISDVASVAGGGTPSTKNDDYWNGAIEWATPTDVTQLNGFWLTDTSRKITEAGFGACSSDLYPRGSILMTSRATIGATCLAARPTAVNQGFIVVQLKDQSLRDWMYVQLGLRTEEFIGWSNGATFMELSKKVFRELPFIVPTPEGLQKFNEFARPAVQRVEALQAENQKLAQTRDELLPLLMDGRITPKDAERVVEEEV